MSTLTPELQFDRADAAPEGTAAVGVTCSGCSAPASTYFQVNGQALCGRCHAALEAARRAPHAGLLVRATGLGLLAAIVGSLIYYGVAELTGYEFGLISIVVGLMVGFAVRKGARARGGWRYQALAMFLTYAAIASTYVPRVMEAVRTQRAETAAATAAGVAPAARGQGSSEGTASGGAAPSSAAPRPGAGQLLLALALLVAFALALPFLAGFQNLMGLVLIAIGLYEAWKVNRAAPYKVSGPYQVGAAPPA